jgi:ADP-heptose:LPS heptosyltransferase
MNVYKSWLNTQALKSVTQPISHPVDSNDKEYASLVGYQKLGWRNLRREFYFLISGQNRYLKSCIQSNWKRGLWIYKGVPQIGDALMDLAPRTLLHKEGISIDLYTDKHLAKLFYGDPWINNIFDDPKLIEKNYDFVIIQSYKRRSLKHKIYLLPNHNWISMHGFYTGPDFHRGKLATQRLLDFLGKEISSNEFNQHQHQKLKPLSKLFSFTPKKEFINIAITPGGVDPSRIYTHWTSLIKEIFKLNLNITITLIGSKNALNDKYLILNDLPKNLKIIDKVNQTTISDCRLLINSQDLLITTDSGLMHLGVTTETKVISLFNSKVNPKWRLPEKHLEFSLQSETTEVSSISVKTIIQLVQKIIKN